MGRKAELFLEFLTAVTCVYFLIFFLSVLTWKLLGFKPLAGGEPLLGGTLHRLMQTISVHRLNNSLASLNSPLLLLVETWF